MAHEHDVYMLLADTAAQRQDAAGVRQYAPRLEALAERDGHQLYLGIAHRAWGVAHRLEGEQAAAQARLRQALAIFAELGTRWQAGRTYFELGELAAARGDPAAARQHFAQALAEFEALGAAPDMARPRDALAALAR